MVKLSRLLAINSFLIDLQTNEFILLALIWHHQNDHRPIKEFVGLKPGIEASVLLIVLYIQHMPEEGYILSAICPRVTPSNAFLRICDHLILSLIFQSNSINWNI